MTSNVTVGALQIASSQTAPVHVLVDPGMTLTVVGSLTITGNAAHPVVFTERSAGQGWGGFLFQGAPTPLLLEHCIIEKATNSGVRVVDSGLVLRHCLIRGNSTQFTGGGILAVNNNSDLVLEDCEIRDNSALNSGGGLHATIGPGFALNMNRCRVWGNAGNRANLNTGSQNSGGGLFLQGHGYLGNCHFRANFVHTHSYGCSIQVGQGGAIYATAGDLALTNCILVDNLAHGNGAGSGCYLGGLGRGGGVAFNANGNALTMTSCFVCGNQSEAAYGDLFREGSGLAILNAASVAIMNCTFARNNKEAVRNYSATAAVSIANSILFFNNDLNTSPTPTYGPQLVVHPGATAIAATYSDVQNGVAGIGNINVNPFFLRPDSALGGPVIHPASPCVDAGDPSGPMDAALPPARGTTRNDMGAHGGQLAGQFSSPCLMVGGAQTYGTTRGGANTLLLDWVPSVNPLVGNVRVQNAGSNDPGTVLVSLADDEFQIGSATVLVGVGGLGMFPFSFDTSGQVQIPLSLAAPVFLGLPIYVQVLAFPPSGVAASNGLALLFY
ncbi:MAG TPA: right-handed parallel beta-helix repeat-containing protein [Planctomycetota bacterium]